MHARIYCPTLVTNMCDLAKGLKLKPITYEGDTPPPVRTAYRTILALRTAYRTILAFRTAYRTI